MCNVAKSGKYYGSVSSVKWKKIFHQELKENPHLFSVQILSFHDSRQEALQEELRIQIDRDVVKSNEYFNESFACPNGFFGKRLTGEDWWKSHAHTVQQLKERKGEKNPFYGKTFKQTEESKKRISESLLKSEKFKRSKSQEWKDKISKTVLEKSQKVVLLDCQTLEKIRIFDNCIDASEKLKCSYSNIKNAIRDQRIIGKRLKTLDRMCYVTTIDKIDEFISSFK